MKVVANFEDADFRFKRPRGYMESKHSRTLYNKAERHRLKLLVRGVAIQKAPKP